MIDSKIDVLIVIAYLLLCMILGFYKLTKIKTLKEYTIGNGQFSTVVIIATLFATGISSSTTIGGVGAIYSLNMVYIIATLLKPMSWVLAGYIYSRRKIVGCLTLPEIMEKFYGGKIRYIVSICVVITSIGFLAVQLTALANIISYCGVNYFYGVLLCALVMIAYSSLGGIQAVAITDLLQFFVFFIVFPIVCTKGIENLGGIKIFLNKIQDLRFQFHLNIYDYIALVGMSLYFIPSEAPFIQRILMQNSRKKIINSFIYTGIISSFFYFTIILIGFIAYVQIPKTESNLVLLMFASENLTTGLIGLMICSLLAVIMSTSDSYLNTISVIVTRDFVLKIFPKDFNENQKLWIARCTSVLIGVLLIPIALQNYKIIDIVFFVTNFYHPIVLIPLLAGFLKIKTTELNFYISMSVAITCTIVGAYIDKKFSVFSASLGILGSLAYFLYLFIISKKIEINYLEKILFALSNTYKLLINTNKNNNSLFFILFSCIHIPILMFAIKYGTTMYNIMLTSIIFNLLVMMHEYWIKYKNNLKFYQNISIVINLVTALLIIKNIYTNEVILLSFLVLVLCIISLSGFGEKILKLLLISIIISMLIINNGDVSGIILNNYSQYFLIYFIILIFFLLGSKFFIYGNNIFVKNNKKDRQINLKDDEIQEYLSNQIKADKKFFEIMERYENLLKLKEKLPINEWNSLRKKFIKEINDFEIKNMSKNIKNIIGGDIIEKGIRVNLQIEDLSTSVNSIMLYQICHSIAVGIANLAKYNSKLEFYIKETKNQFIMEVQYESYFNSEREILNYLKDKKVVNPHILTLPEIINLIKNQGMEYNIEQLNGIGKIKISKNKLRSNIIKLYRS